MKYIVEFTIPPDDRDGTCGVRIEDHGQAMIMNAPLNTGEPGLNPETWAKEIEGGDDCFFIRLHSWDEKKKHPLFRQLMGKKVRIILETIE